MQIGARVMAVVDQHQLSGAIYGFSAWAGRGVLDRLRGLMINPGTEDENDILEAGLEIIEGWLEQYLVPAPLPQIVHNSTGEPLLLHTDPLRRSVT